MKKDIQSYSRSETMNFKYVACSKNDTSLICYVESQWLVRVLKPVRNTTRVCAYA